ncbi:MAG TPA: hypothetical protein DC049_06505 [Spirochaetia bacterium]|nr:hypothetical protein [Spirochaetia bacterium]
MASAALGKTTVAAAGQDGIIYCFEQNNGNPVFSFRTHGEINCSPVYIADAVLAGSDDGFIYLLSLTGEEIWSYRAGSEILSPAYCRGIIIVPLAGGFLLAFREAS